MDEDCDIYADLDLLPVPDFGAETNLKRKCPTNESVASSKSRRADDDRVHRHNNQNSSRELNCQTDVRRRNSREDRKRESKEREACDRKRESKERAFSRSGSSSGDRSSDRSDRRTSHPSDRHRRSSADKLSESSSQSNVQASKVHSSKAHPPNVQAPNVHSLKAHSSNALASKATDRILNQNKPRQSPRKSPRKSPHESPCKSPRKSPRKSPYSRPSPSSKSPRKSKSSNSGDHLAELIILEEKLLRLEEKCTALEREKEQKAKANLELNRTVTVLKTNISSLYKTAKTEIDRKGQQIKELQSELDSLKFRKFKRADQGANWYAQASQAPANQLNQFYW